MSTRAFLAGVAMSAAPLAAEVAGFMPTRWHAGKRANQALAGVRDASRGHWLEKGVLESRWLSLVLYRYVLGLGRDELHTFFEDRVRYDGSTWPLDERRPLILAAPHYGASAVGFLAAVHRMHRRRPVNLFFNDESGARHVVGFFDRAGFDVSQLHGGVSGSVAALRALRRGECLIMMPDTFADDPRTLVVPFFGRLMRVAAGTAFLALRSNALVVPVFATAGSNLTLDVRVDTAIDARRFAGDEEQRIFSLSHALFMRFEAMFRGNPEHWHGWESFPGISTAIDPAYRLDYDEPLRVLRAKCETLPYLVQEIPELDQICK
jgi:hypothetical protein